MADPIVPIPQVNASVRPATTDDLPFLDALQKRHGKALGFFPRAQMQGYVENGWVLVAQDGGTGRAIGYCASRDRYLKRDELGVIYQLCVEPGRQRGLIGATLVREVFARSAYGCRLYCCWCAQDLEANRFWESLGFVPLAFRAGSDKKRRVHIFWQKRIVKGDTGQASDCPRTGGTKWWYPFQTNGGAIRADRLVLPIPPGVHWSEVEGVELPVAGGQLPVTGKKTRTPLTTGNRQPATVPPPGKVGILVGGRIKYVDRPRNPGDVAPPAAAAPPVPLLPAPRKPKRAKREVAPVDPALLAKVRELRDRYLEHVNGGGGRLGGAGKYDPSRTLGEVGGTRAMGTRGANLLPHAA